MIVDVDVEVPVGSILPFAGPINACTRKELKRRGWLFCDGASVYAAEYPELYAVIRRLYGWEDAHKNDAGVFCIPDCQGMFLRGVNHCAKRPDGTCRDPGADDRDFARPANQSGNKGNAVGSTQLDAFQDHEHEFKQAKAGPGSDFGTEGPPMGLIYETPPTEKVEAGSGSEATPRARSETRPINLYVNYIIKARARVPAYDERGWCTDTKENTGPSCSCQDPLEPSDAPAPHAPEPLVPPYTRST